MGLAESNFRRFLYSLNWTGQHRVEESSLEEAWWAQPGPQGSMTVMVSTVRARSLNCARTLAGPQLPQGVRRSENAVGQRMPGITVWGSQLQLLLTLARRRYKHLLQATLDPEAPSPNQP